MSLLTSICVPNISPIPPYGLVDIYVDYDDYTTPIQSNVPVSAMTGNNCPYFLSIPSGTTTIHLDYGNSTRICINLTDPCTTCNLGFDLYSESTIGQIVVGSLTGSCESITDYVINWYGPGPNSYDENNPSQNIVFRSGYGPEFLGEYNYTHPLIGNQSVPMIPGNFIPVISKIKIDGITYSLTGDTGTIQTNLNCLYPTIVVSAYTCSDTNITGDYSTSVKFETTGDFQIPPDSMTTALKVDTNINFVAFEFIGYNIPDRFKVEFSGSSYNTTLLLEDIVVGRDATVPFYFDDINILPKSFPYGQDGSFKKVICLTGLTRTSEDYLLLSVLPNQTNNATSWEIKWKCLESFDCSMCLDSFVNSSYKIIESTINVTSGTCNTVNPKFTISGCSIEEQSQSYISKYTQTDNLYYPGGKNPFSFTYTTNSEYCELNIAYQSAQTFFVCRPDQGNGTITSRKYLSGTTNTISVVEFTFTNYNDFIQCYNDYNSINTSFSGTPNNPLSLDYYRYYYMQICTATGNQNCGDNSGQIILFIHPSSIVTTGETSNIYLLSFTLPKITNQLTLTNCQLGCQGLVDLIVDNVNYSSNHPNFNITSNVAARFSILFPVGYRVGLYSGGTSSYELAAYTTTYEYSFDTYVYTGSVGNYVVVPSLTATTCNLKQYGIGANQKFLANWYLTIESPNPSDLNQFNIYMRPITNFVPGSPELAYSFSAGTVQYSNPNYII